MERSELLKKIKRRACSLIRSNSMLSAVEYRSLNCVSDKDVINEGVKIIMNRIAKGL